MRFLSFARLASLVILSSACGARSELFGVETSGDARPGTLGFDADLPSVDSIAPRDVAIDSFVDAPPSVECPKDPPSTASACAIVGAVCTYRRGKVGPCSDASASDQVVVRCEREGWLEIARCIDPTACPPVMPTEGQSCSAQGLDCFYSATTCAKESIFQCESSHWHAVNDCGARATEVACVPTATLVGDARLLLDTSGTIADRTSLATAGTQLLAAYTLTPMLGGSESVGASVVQSAVPSMAKTVGFVGSGTFFGDSMSAVDFAGNRFLLGWGSREPGHIGAFATSTPLEGSKWAEPSGLPTKPTEEIDIAGVMREGVLYTWLVTRSALGDGKSGVGTLAMSLADRTPRDTLDLADERPHGSEAALEHAWARVTRWGDGIVIAASVPASGDLWDDTGINVFFIADPRDTTLSKHVRLPVGQTLDGDVTALADGMVIVGYRPSHPTESRYPYRLVSVLPDGTHEELPAIDVGVATSPGPLSLVPFEKGFASVFSAIRGTSPDFIPGFLTISVRDAKGAMIVSPILEEAPDLRTGVPLGVAFSAADRALHVAWTRRRGGTTSSTAQVLRQRFVCRGPGPD